MPANYFANQGSSIEILREQSYLFTTSRYRDGKFSPNFQVLGDMPVGAKIVINDGGLVGIATVRRHTDNAPMAEDFAKLTNAWDAKHGVRDNFWKAGTLGLRVDVDYEEFGTKIRYQEHLDRLVAAQNKSHTKRQPFNDSSANHGTFYSLTPEVAQVIADILYERTGNRHLPDSVLGGWSASGRPEVSVPSNAHDGPYVPKFAPREQRLQQSAFRDLMMQVWNGTCPVTRTTMSELLEAAHFEDWREHNDAAAGMLLDTRIHAAVDAGIIKI
ncbi:MAG: hypothetical protein JSS14_23270 [Proteobacteria bacterium]|nr:hypothetical protein [Pseudomonadota bacterium]